MNPWFYFALAIIGLVLAVWIPHWRLKRAIAAPFPAEWARLLEDNILVYRRLPMPLRQQLRRLIKQFLHPVHFTGAAGLEIDDEIRVTIAAEACMLVLNRHTGVYPGLRYIIVYPTTFVVDREEYDEAGVVEYGPQEMLGESWQEGKVILAWDAVQHGSRNFADGRNVVLHEFAHQLDAEFGGHDGAPLLGGAHSYRAWAEVLSGEFEDLQERSRRGKPSLMDEYGATHPAEFFAVATETFFEKPRQMAKYHAELFEVLLAYYRIDPRDWLSD